MSNKNQRVLSKEIRQKILEKALDVAGKDSQVIDRRVAVTAAREQIFLGGLEATLKKVFTKGYATPKPYKGKKGIKPKYINNILLSDLHYRSLLDPEEVPRPYGSNEEARRTGKIAHQVAEYKREHRKDSRLYVHLAGDIIQGQLHDGREGDPLTMQFAGALHYLTQLMFYWSANYPKVDIFCVPGNHGRITSRHHQRAVQQKWDAIETMLYISLKSAISQTEAAKNTTVHIGKRAYYTYDAFDQKGFVTHGDTVLKVGYPGKVIKVDDIRNQTLKWNNARGVGGPFQLFAAGHVHIASEAMLPGNIAVITNGCLVPPDPFSISIGAPDVTCGQLVWESVPGHILGDKRFITVDDADEEPSYEEIIKPFHCLL